MRTEELFAFIKERHNIYCARQRGEPKPWTRDPILRRYRFCNMYRELDRVTIWIREHWRDPHRKDADLWFAMMVARMFNLPYTLGLIGYPVPYEPARMRKIVRAAQDAGDTVFSGAYMIRCDCQRPGKTKVDYLVDSVFGPAWRQREALRPRRGDSLSQFHSRLMTCYGLGSFMAAQIVADTKFVPPLKDAADWWTWAAPGPGSMRGLNRVFGGEPKKPWKGNSWSVALAMLQIEIDKLAKEAGMPRISAQDLQNINCEFDKYERARLGEGRPKQLYPGV